MPDETLDRGCQRDRNYHRSFRSTGGTSPVRSGVSALLDGGSNDGPDDEMNEQVRLLRVNGRLEIALAGTLTSILALTSNNPRRDARGLKVTVVAGRIATTTVDARISSGVTVS